MHFAGLNKQCGVSVTQCRVNHSHVTARASGFTTGARWVSSWALTGSSRMNALKISVYGGRDVKPENLLVRTAGEEEGVAARTGAADGGLHVRLIDFGSAIDAHSLRHLYGPGGPSDREQTPEYAPPEAVLGRWAGPPHCALPRWAMQSSSAVASCCLPSASLARRCAPEDAAGMLVCCLHSLREAVNQPPCTGG